MEKNKGKNYTLAIFLSIAFILETLVILTDQNLRTDFGSVHPYFIHWYIFLALDVITIFVVVAVLALNKKTSARIGLAWSLIMVIIMVGDILTYSSVGFSTPSQFAEYLFSFSKYPETLNYIPGLYPLIFIVYLVSIVIALYYSKKSS